MNYNKITMTVYFYFSNLFSDSLVDLSNDQPTQF